MLQVVVPVFLVILVGYLFGRKHHFSLEAEKLINDYVLFIALPALLFLAVARANPLDLAKWEFVVATLAGIGAAYFAGTFWARSRGIKSPRSSLVGMTSCYGTTGYMGIPMLVAAFGPQAAVPAAVATVLHNIPAIMMVIVTHDMAGRDDQSSLLSSIGRACIIPLKNPLTIAVLAGAAFSFLRVPLPGVAVQFAEFLASAAGPTALFAPGLGLARIRISRESVSKKVGWVLSTVTFKIVLQPIVTLVVLIVLVGMNIDIWFATALVMASQPIGAGAYVFATKYGYFSEETSIGIVASLLVTIVTLSIILQVVGSQLQTP